jgi:large subunit ribosomal protein L35
MKQLPVYINNQLVQNKDILLLEVTKSEPKIKLNLEKDKYYTIMMVDPDAPSKENPKYKYFLHWLIINTNDKIIDFMPPSPPIGSGLHRYYICLFEQLNKIDKVHITERIKFDVDYFCRQHDLVLIGSIMFMTEDK